jgi:ABC-type nitrate/sulfonate/bicarbonate transport system substrate-binding protein
MVVDQNIQRSNFSRGRNESCTSKRDDSIKVRQRIKLHLCVALTMIAFGGGISVASAADKVLMTIPITTISFAPYLLAMEKGYYAAEGLDVQRVNAQGSVATAALISGGADVSTSSSAALSAMLRGASLKIVYTMMDRPNYQLWSTQPELKTLQDLKGKSVGVQTRGDTNEVTTHLALLAAGLPPDWVAYTAIGTGAVGRAVIQSGALPAIMASKEDIESLRGTPALERGHLIVDTFKTIRMPYTGAVVSNKLLASNPGLVKRYLRATLKGMRYMRTFRAETNAILKRLGADEDDRTLEVNYTAVVATLTDKGEETDDVLKNDMAVRASLLNIPADQVRPVKDIYDYTLLREANDELDKAGWKPTP